MGRVTGSSRAAPIMGDGMRMINLHSRGREEQLQANCTERQFIKKRLSAAHEYSK